MTIPTTFLKNTTGGSFTAQKIGGVVVGVTSATDTTDGQPVTVVKPISSMASDNLSRLNKLVEKTGVNSGAFNLTKTLSGGTFAYNQAAFMIRTSATTINGSANTSLLFAASEKYRTANKMKQKAIGAKVLTAWRNRGWIAIGVSGQRSNWDAAATGVNAAGILDTLNDNYVSTADGTSDSDDEAVNFGAVPAHLTWYTAALGKPTDAAYAVNHLR